jgi:hypothetical protein
MKLFAWLGNQGIGDTANLIIEGDRVRNGIGGDVRKAEPPTTRPELLATSSGPKEWWL